ncbi:MAG: GNAT family N-acetyltransferase [Candidatus Omnitrophica bacterium]|nr:GNAT family N-acetyltransferase [Candidatus Omnitrophota bacterium]MCA9446015.1 GNAT family N-acetyltransferase [Candidatus Omnitrophota bacterium]
MWNQWRNWAERYATSFFQSAEWAETLIRHYPFYHPEPIHSENYFLPLIRHKRWGWISDSLYGMPLMSTGGLLAADGDREEGWRRTLAILARKQVGTTVLSLPTATGPVTPPDGFQSLEESTHLIDLRPGWDSVYSGFKKSCKEAIRRAGRLGVEVQREENPEGVEAHWSLITGEFEKWRPNPPITREFIKDLVNLPQARLYLALVEDRPVLSLLSFVYGGELFLWQSAKASIEFPPGTSNLLSSTLFREACEEGVQTVNYGTSLGNRSIEKYKESYGAVKTPYMILKRVHPFVRWIR